jgi:hypothetical protein
LLDAAWVRHLQGPVTILLMVEVAELTDLLSQVQLTAQPDTFVRSFSGPARPVVSNASGLRDERVRSLLRS